MDIPENITDLTREQLDELREQATARATELRDAAPTAETVDELNKVADTLDQVVTRLADLDAQDASRADALARIEALQQRAAEQAEQATAEQTEPEPAAVEAEPVVEQPVEEPVAVAASASAGTAAAPRKVADIATTTTATASAAPAVTRPRGEWFRSLTAGAEISGVSAGSVFDTSSAVGVAFQRRAQAMLQARAAGKSVVANAHLDGLGDVVTKSTGAMDTTQRLLASISDYQANRDQPDRNVITAAGFCGPCDTIMDFCEPEVADQLIDLPSIGIGRGCIEYYPGIDFSDFDDYLGGEYCQEDLENGVEKPCPEIPCPEPIEEQACVITACATADIVSNWSMSEWTERYVRGILTRHQVRLSNATLARMEAGSTEVLYADADFAGWGFTAALLSAIEVQAEDIRADSYLGMGDTIRVVMDRWVRAAIRADLVNRGGVDFLSVSNRRIDEIFRERGIVVTWVKNWQSNHIGQPDAQLKYPNKVRFMIYRDGSWVRGLEPVIELSNVYDAALLKQNKFTRIFTEQAFLVVNMCGDSRVVEVPVCPSGVTAAPVEAECLSEAPVAA